ncbi:MAG: winged helix-turn-helix domain-containing protein [Pyrinomonadaceae bacterium]
MNQQAKHFYEFGPFRIDPAERLLLRDGRELKLFPKDFDTLLLLVKNSGHVMEKDELLKEVWPDTIVEEGSLAQNVSRLRKILGEGSHESLYIETLPKRGYRFVAQVREVTDSGADLIIRRHARSHIIKREEESDAPEDMKPVEDLQQRATVSAPLAESETKPLAGKSAHRSVIVISTLAALVVAALGIALGIKYVWRKSAEPFDKMKVARLTTSGSASAATISPDGKYLAHATGGRNQQSLWLMHIATGSDKEIVPQSQVTYTGLTFSPDGNYIYFNRWEAVDGALYRVPVLGGPIKLLGRDIDSCVTLSPDGSRMAFMRGYPQKDIAVLAVANTDGTQEQALITKQGQMDVYPSLSRAWGWGPTWSPDGRMIAFALRKTEADGQFWNIVVVGVKDGLEHQITFQKWLSLGQLVWLKDGSGLIVVAAGQESAPAQQLWHVKYPGGAARKITNDTNDYSGLSLTADAKALATVRLDRTSNIWTAPVGGDTGRAAQLTSSYADGVAGLAWTPDGRILYTTKTHGASNLWMMNPDRTGQQLTVDAGNNIRPSVSPDGRYVVFASDRTGNFCIWRMDIDGSNPRQLTNGSYATRPKISPDGRWVIYSDKESGRDRIWKVSIDGGNPVQLTDYSSSASAISPDGKQLAITFTDEQAKPPRWRFAVIPFEGGPPTKVFDLANPIGQIVDWTPDGRALTYVETRNGVSNIWSQPVDGSPPKQLTNFNSDQILSYAWSRDGSQLALARGTEMRDVVLISDLQ